MEREGAKEKRKEESKEEGKTRKEERGIYYLRREVSQFTK